MTGFEMWMAAAPKTEEEWFELEIGWAKTYLQHNTPIRDGYFSKSVIEEAKKRMDE
jgi:hypothetical protein